MADCQEKEEEEGFQGEREEVWEGRGVSHLREAGSEEKEEGGSGVRK